VRLLGCFCTNPDIIAIDEDETGLGDYRLFEDLFLHNKEARYYMNYLSFLLLTESFVIYEIDFNPNCV